RLIERHQPETLWVLGDLLHGPILDAPWIDRWQDFRRAHLSLSIQVIAGNHDRQLTDAMAQQLGLQAIREDLVVEGLHLCHEPRLGASLPMLCGHLHPCIKLPGLPRRWPSFQLQEQCLVLPAFSLLTGGSPLDPRGSRWFACVAGEIVPGGS
ncbi:MAG: phosphoesterase, partial [Xanthomonadales bacterium]|nr:phosphoesterase [Xanthomonadales bacterium]